MCTMCKHAQSARPTVYVSVVWWYFHYDEDKYQSRYINISGKFIPEAQLLCTEHRFVTTTKVCLCRISDLSSQCFLVPFQRMSSAFWGRSGQHQARVWHRMTPQIRLVNGGMVNTCLTVILNYIDLSHPLTAWEDFLCFHCSVRVLHG